MPDLELPNASIVITPSILYYGTPITLITTLNEDGTANISPISSSWALGDRVLLGFKYIPVLDVRVEPLFARQNVKILDVKNRFYNSVPGMRMTLHHLSFNWEILSLDAQGFLNLERTRECVINVTSPATLEGIGRIADTTGRNPPLNTGRTYRFEADKFALGGFTRLRSEWVSPPRVAQCPLQLEAKVLAIHPLALDFGCAAVETKVVRVHAHEEIVVPGTNHIDPLKWQPLFYVFRHYFSTGERLGKNDWAEV
jgi:flavin reductase (DIM6/NTAB) family NADH-FMN oxidoreductase RutF